MKLSAHQTAALLIIGNEILSGRTREANAWLAARRLFARGCKLKEIAIVPDERNAIIGALNRLRTAFDAVITSGGIGPTHDDITMECVAAAFDAPLLEHEATLALMRAHYGEDRLNPGRRRMARLPAGAHPIVCARSIAPGAHIGNVYVLAGVPEIFASQLDAVVDEFGGRGFMRKEIEVRLPESRFAAALADIQRQFPDVEIGSYPQHCGDRPQGKICLSAQDEARLAQACDAVRVMLERISPS